MKKFILNPILASLIFISLLLLVSCTKDQDLMENNIAPEASVELNTAIGIADDVTVVNGILKFNTPEDLRGTVLALSRMDRAERYAWESKLGFNSMDKVFYDIILAEWPLRDNAEEGLRSDIFKEKLAAGLIKIDDPETGRYSLNIASEGYAPILNERGLVMEGNTIYHVAPDAIKIWREADINNLEAILNATSSSENIEVFPFAEDTDGLRTTYRNVYAYSYGPRTRLILRENYRPYMYSSNELFMLYFIQAMPFYRNYYGYYFYDYNATVKLKGRTNGELFYIRDGVPVARPWAYNYGEMFFTGPTTFYPDIYGYHYAIPPDRFNGTPELISSRWEAWSKSYADNYWNFCTLLY